MGAFHAYDIRGVYNKDFDKDTVYKVGYFIPRLLSTDKVLVGRDVRISSPEIHEYLTKGITDAGADVYDLGLSTTPMVYFATAKYAFKASVQITASHNPKEYNGLKVSGENALPVGLDNGLGRIRQWIDDGEPTVPVQSKGTVREMDVRDEYLHFLLSYKEDYSDLKIGMDVSNGMAALFVKDIFGDSPLYLYDELDGTFPNHEANPLIPENVADLKRLVADNGCDIGVIYDGDEYFVPFAALVFSVRETGEKYAFLSSLIADDYTLFKLDGNVAFVSSVLDQNAVARVLDMKKSTKQGIDELRKRMSLNSKLQKLKRRYTLDEDEPFLAYLKEPSFYADGKKLTFFLIDPLLEKVDFRHVQAAKERFAQLSMKTVNK